MPSIRAFWMVISGLTLLLLLGSIVLLYGEEKKQDRPTFVTPKSGDPLYVLDRWFVSDLHETGDELVLVLNIGVYGKPKEKIRAMGIVFKNKEKALIPFKNLVHALEGLKATR